LITKDQLNMFQAIFCPSSRA